jgi:hypothetical protein
MSARAMRILLCVGAAAALSAVVSCGKKSSVATAPLSVDSVNVAGAWTGCIAEPHVSCAPVSMTLTDSSLTDSTATLGGSGNWGDAVTIAGHSTDARVTLSGATVAVLQAWTFVGVVSGDTLTGTLAIPGVDSAYTTTFTRTP